MVCVFVPSRVTETLVCVQWDPVGPCLSSKPTGTYYMGTCDGTGEHKLLRMVKLTFVSSHPSVWSEHFLREGEKPTTTERREARDGLSSPGIHPLKTWVVHTHAAYNLTVWVPGSISHPKKPRQRLDK